MKDITQKQLYEKLFNLYQNFIITDDQKDWNESYSKWYKKVKPLRTCVNRSVEFYASKLNIPFQISSDSQAVIDAIKQFYKWSNFEAIKPVLIRYLSLDGNLFVKILGNSDKVWFENIDPKYVTDFDVDNRGYLTEIRIDIPIVENNRNLTYTEYWSKADGYYAIWKHALGENAKLDQLGEPFDSGFLAEIGSDNFIPIVFVQFRNIGTKYGSGCVNHALEKIEQANKEADRLSDLLFRFNKPVTAVSAGSEDKNGRPMPAPKLDDEDIYDSKDGSIIYLPGKATVSNLIPPIDYDAALKILEATMNELESDLPELRYYSLKESNLSGKAIKLTLAGAIDRAEEALSNFKSGIKRVNEIALTIGSFWGLINVGSYESGDFEHEIITPELFPLSEDEKATLLKDLTIAGLALATALRIAGYDEDFIKTALEEKQNQDSQAQTNFMTQFNQV